MAYKFAKAKCDTCGASLVDSTPAGVKKIPNPAGDNEGPEVNMAPCPSCHNFNLVIEVAD